MGWKRAEWARKKLNYAQIAKKYSFRAPLVHDTIFPKVWNNPIDRNIYRKIFFTIIYMYMVCMG
jgi:hypothetical protein